MMKKKILIIDDCFPILNALSIALEMHHYEVETAQNGTPLLDDKQAMPDVVLVDYHIPNVNIIDVLNQFKAKNHSKHIPIILMSGSIDLEKTARDLEVDDFIAKPMNLDDLLNKLNAIIA